MKRLMVGLFVVVAAATLIAVDGPLTPLMNLATRTDSTGYLMVTNTGSGTGATTPLTAMANLSGRTDANGYLMVALGAATVPFLIPDGTALAPALALASDPTTGLYGSAGIVRVSCGNVANCAVFTNGAASVNGTFAAGFISQSTTVTAGTDVTTTQTGDIPHGRYQATITPATGGAGNCATAFKAAALTADCTIATLPAGMKLTDIKADVTAGFTCSGTCTGTKVLQCGTSAGAVDVLAAAFNVAVTGTAGLTDAQMGSAMVRAAQIDGGFLPSWSATTPISCRFTSGTGNWGNGAATFVNAGSVKFTLIAEQVK